MAAAAACYTPDGTNRNELLNATNGWFYAPCHPDGSVSMCCAIGPGRDGTQDTCLASDLCYNSVGGVTWRESCTDPTWQDPACLKLFVNGTGINETMGTQTDSDGNPITDVSVTQCDNGSYCYGSDNRACCQQGQGVFLLNGEQVTFNPNQTTTSSVSSATTASTPSSVSASPTSSASPTPTASNDNGLSTGAKAGIGVGAAIGGLLVFALLFWLLWRTAKRRKPQVQRSELAGEPAPAMLESPQPRHELLSPETPGRSDMTDSSRWSGSGEESVAKKARQNGPSEMSA